MKFVRRLMRVGLRMCMAVCVMTLAAACKKDATSGYAVDLTVTDVTQTYLYSYLMFREAEDAWATLDSYNYPEDSVITDNARGKRVITTSTQQLDETYFIATTVDFTDWTWNDLRINGRMELNMPTAVVDSSTMMVALTASYRQSGTMTALLKGFTVNGQQMDGFGNIVYSGTAEQDKYTFSLADGKIYDLSGNQLLTTASLSSAAFVRTAGAETIAEPTDDVWTTTTAMRGNLRNQSALTYSNTIDAEYPMLFDWGCSRKPRQGNCSLTAGSRQIAYYCGNGCDDPIEVLTVTSVK